MSIINQLKYATSCCHALNISLLSTREVNNPVAYSLEISLLHRINLFSLVIASCCTYIYIEFAMNHLQAESVGRVGDLMMLDLRG